METGGGSPQGRSPPHRWAPWTELLPDVAGSLLRLLSLADRKSWNAVCRSWRDLARHSRPIPRLPVLFFANLSFSSLTISGDMTALRAIDDLPFEGQNCVGCYDDWVLALREGGSSSSSDAQYILYNPFTKLCQSFIWPPSWSQERSAQPLQQLGKFVSIHGTLFFARYSVCQPGEGTAHLNKVVFSASPSPDSLYIAAAATPDCLMFLHRETWYRCTCEMLSGPKDLLFIADRLFVLMSTNGLIFAFDFEKTQDGLSLRHIEKIPLKVPAAPNTRLTRNIVHWHGKPVLIIRSSLFTDTWNDIVSISLYQIDLSTLPPQYSQLKNLKGDNLFVSSTCSKIFPANFHDEVPGDNVIAVDNSLELAVFKYGLADAGAKLVPLGILATDLPAAQLNMFWVFRE